MGLIEHDNGFLVFLLLPTFARTWKQDIHSENYFRGWIWRCFVVSYEETSNMPEIHLRFYFAKMVRSERTTAMRLVEEAQ